MIEVNETLDTASIFCGNSKIRTFTGDDVLKRIGLAKKMKMPDLRELVKPHHLKIVSEKLGV